MVFSLRRGDHGVVDKHHQGLLHAAVSRPDGLPIVRALLLVGEVDRSAKNRWGKTALDISRNLTRTGFSVTSSAGPCLAAEDELANKGCYVNNEAVFRGLNLAPSTWEKIAHYEELERKKLASADGTLPSTPASNRTDP
jgi:hypothetical protein